MSISLNDPLSSPGANALFRRSPPEELLGDVSMATMVGLLNQAGRPAAASADPDRISHTHPCRLPSQLGQLSTVAADLFDSLGEEVASRPQSVIHAQTIAHPLNHLPGGAELRAARHAPRPPRRGDRAAGAGATPHLPPCLSGALGGGVGVCGCPRRLALRTGPSTPHVRVMFSCSPHNRCRGIACHVRELCS